MRIRGRKFGQAAVYGKAAAGGSSLTFTATDVSQAWQSSSISLPVNFTADIGTASADRRVVVAVLVDGSATQGILSSIVVNGVTITTPDAFLDSSNALNIGSYIYSALITSGSGAQTITVNGSGAFPAGVVIAVGNIKGTSTSALSASNTRIVTVSSDPQTITAAVPANGVGVVCVGIDRAVTPVWSNATGDINTREPNQNLVTMLMAHTTNNSPSFTGANGFGVQMAAATYAP